MRFLVSSEWGQIPVLLPTRLDHLHASWTFPPACDPASSFPKVHNWCGSWTETWRYPQQLVTRCCCGLWWIFRKHREERWGGLGSRWRTLDYVQVGFMLEERFCADCRFIKYVHPPAMKLKPRAWQAPRIHSHLVMTLSCCLLESLEISYKPSGHAEIFLLENRH